MWIVVYWQADMYKCSARCAEDTSLPANRVEPCIENCSRVLQSFQEEVGRELESFQVTFKYGTAPVFGNKILHICV